MELMAVAAAFVLAALIIHYLIPDHFKPWWEQSRRDIRQGQRMPMRLIRVAGSAMDWPVKALVKHFEKRFFEFATGLIMLSVGALLVFSPASLEASAMRYLLERITVEHCSQVLTLAGVARIVALGLNGNWMPYGGWIRAGGAAVGALMWGQWAAALFELHLKTGLPISPGVPVYAILSLCEVVSYFWALNGVVGGHERISRPDLGNRQRMAPHPANKPYRVHRRRDPAGGADPQSLSFPPA